MDERVDLRRYGRSGRVKGYLWLLLSVAVILLIPFIAMQVTEEVQWGPGDFLVMGTLLLVLGSLCIFVLGKVASRWRLPVIGLFILTFLWVWAELAVGVFTDLGQ
ncbi:hypothetical protein AUP74_01881 [Microbulbifer aggregans]|uniref:Uncharacterized protein n=1 Tax=Microbulbifer aggregans TaxID=1769779 RepID=A0A1C9W833_9GAMM|nr:hypothetical protein [Microbulbifer aggregans]AOS97312.1 hypothetical protein AUP74_01881 [Microbulbifer aggregans]